jgi:hypothetical protein
VNGQAITRLARILPWAWLILYGKSISIWMYLGSADMIFLYVWKLVCPASYQYWLVSETVFGHDRLYMNLTGHTLKGFRTLKNLPIWLSLVQVGDYWWCAQEAIITIRIKTPRIFDPSRIRVLMGLQLGSSIVCSINTRGGARGDRRAYTPTHHHVKP